MAERNQPGERTRTDGGASNDQIRQRLEELAQTEGWQSSEPPSPSPAQARGMDATPTKIENSEIGEPGQPLDLSWPRLIDDVPLDGGYFDYYHATGHLFPKWEGMEAHFRDALSKPESEFEFDDEDWAELKLAVGQTFFDEQQLLEHAARHLQAEGMPKLVVMLKNRQAHLRALRPLINRYIIEPYIHPLMQKEGSPELELA